MFYGGIIRAYMSHECYAGYSDVTLSQMRSALRSVSSVVVLASVTQQDFKFVGMEYIPRSKQARGISTKNGCLILRVTC